MVTECCSESRMRSRTSRGVPEWSGGKDLYIGSPVSAIGTSFGVIGIVPGPPGGATCPGGHMGCRGCALAYMGQGHQPLEAHAPRYRKKGRVLKGEGTSEVPWGGWTPPPSLAAPLPWRRGQGCALPLSLGPIYSGEKEKQSHLRPGASLSLP